MLKGQNIAFNRCYTQFKKYFSKINTDNMLSKKGINLIFSKTKEGDNIVFSPLRSENES